MNSFWKPNLEQLLGLAEKHVNAMDPELAEIRHEAVKNQVAAKR